MYVRTYGDVTDDVPFGYRPHIRKFRDTIYEILMQLHNGWTISLRR